MCSIQPVDGEVVLEGRRLKQAARARGAMNSESHISEVDSRVQSLSL